MVHLPEKFSDLEIYLDWPASTEWDRQKIRTDRPDAELRAFYDAMLPRLDAIVDHLNRFPLDAMPDSELALFNMAKMMMEVSSIIERGRSRHGPHFDIARFIPMHEKRVF